MAYQFPIILLTIITFITLCNLQKITNRSVLIELINKKQTTWTAGENFPENVSLDSLKLLNGALLDTDIKLNVKTHLIERSSIPETFDAREKWSYCKDVIETIRDQGKCGSCWSFAASEVISDRVCIQSRGKIQFSPQDFLECCLNCVPAGRDTCAGGYINQAWLYWLNYGVVSGGDYNSNLGCKPYSSSAYNYGIGPKKCNLQCQTGYSKKYKSDKIRGKEAYKIANDVQQIQTEILNNGPVSVLYKVYADFYNYKSGVYKHISGSYQGNHAVKIIGWGTENGVPYWLAANSWGSKWGLNGFFKILRGSNHCSIEENVFAGKSSASVFLALPVFIIIITIINFLI